MHVTEAWRWTEPAGKTGGENLTAASGGRRGEGAAYAWRPLDRSAYRCALCSLSQQSLSLSVSQSAVSRSLSLSVSQSLSLTVSQSLSLSVSQSLSLSAALHSEAANARRPRGCCPSHTLTHTHTHMQACMDGMPPQWRVAAVAPACLRCVR